MAWARQHYDPEAIPAAVPNLATASLGAPPTAALEVPEARDPTAASVKAAEACEKVVALHAGGEGEDA